MTKNAEHHWEENTTINQTSGIGAGDSLVVQNGNDMTFKGATVAAGQDMAVIAGGTQDFQQTPPTSTRSRRKQPQHRALKVHRP